MKFVNGSLVFLRPAPVRTARCHPGMYHGAGFHRLSIFGGCSNVCKTTQYCSVFSCKARSCSGVASGASTSNCARIASKPTVTSFDNPKVPCKSISPVTVTSMRRVGTPIAVATSWHVSWAHAAKAPSNKSPEHAAVPEPPTPVCASAWYIARPISTEHDSGVDVSLPFAVRVMRELAGSRRYCSFNGFCSDLISKGPPIF